MDIRQVWRAFLLQHTFARQYPAAYQISSGAMSAAPRNPVLEAILPTLLHIKLAAILDDALEEHLAASSISLPRGYRCDLNGRISYFDDNGLVDNGSDLHEVRGRRNDAGHEPFSQITWDQLGEDIDHVGHALEQLGFVGPRPLFRIVSERSAFQHSEEPGILGYHDYAVRALHDDAVAGEFKWRTTFYDDTAR